MSKPLPEKVHESYLLVRDDEGWKLIHPDHGPCLVVTEQEMGIATKLNFERMVIGETEQGLSVMNNYEDDIVNVKDQLHLDGYTKRDIKKMNLRYTNTVCFSY